MRNAWGEPSTNPLTGLPEYGFFSKLKKAVKFENFGVKRLIKGVKKDPLTLLVDPARTPAGTKLYNTVTGKKLKPLTGQLGGHSKDAYAEYGKDPGYAPQLNKIAETIAGMYGGQAVGGLAGNAGSAVGSKFGGEVGGKVGSQVGSRVGGMAVNAAKNADQPSDDSSTFGASTTSGSTSGFNMPTKLPKNATYSTRDAWFTDTARDALGRATALADRPYTEYGGERVAGLSANEQQAGALARDMGNKYAPMVSRLQTGFSSDSLAPYMNPYTDAVLGARTRGINTEFGQQASALDRNQAATDAFRSGRSDLARARLQLGKMRALDDATNEVKSAAFESGKDSFFRQGSQDASAIGALSGADSAQIGALNQTGAAERGVRQAQNDFNYGQFLEARDWDVNNLNNLLAAIGAVNPGAGTLSIGKNAKNASSNADWAAVAGTVASAVGEYYGSGKGGTYGGGSTNTGSGMSDWGGGNTGGGFGGTYGV